MTTIRRLSGWQPDDLILLDISDEDHHDLRRADLHVRNIGSHLAEIVRSLAKVCVMPLTVGGRIRTLDGIRNLLAAGADKCAINTMAIEDPEFVERASRRFGSQCVVVSIDARRHENGRYEVYTRGGTHATGLDPVEAAVRVERAGAGEIFLNSIDRDGSGRGYDTVLIRSVVEATTIPVIACGGVGPYDDFAAGIAEGGASAVAAANIFHFFELSYVRAKEACLRAGLPMRRSQVDSRWMPREPDYEQRVEDRLIAARRAGRRPAGLSDRPPRRPMRWCRRCVYPVLSATPMVLDEEGVCMGCRVAEAKRAMTEEAWVRRRERLRAILEKYRRRDGAGYDCIIPVSGGKDSYFQTHVIKHEFGLNPLLVTYNANNWTEAGWRNVHRMKEVFDVDHVFFSPGVGLLKKLNRLGLLVMGDMSWHAHMGIGTCPVRVAVQTETPLLIWGEHGYVDLCGQFTMDDFPEMTYRSRLEHFGRGYEWNYFVGREGITAQHMLPYRYPTDRELLDHGIRGIYLGLYVYWEANDHGRMVMDRYDWKPSDEPFERTYRTMSNLDDMHENGVHDYLKYIKFGYGRCTDHASKDIRAGFMTRDEAIELVRRHDHVKPCDLDRWLEYVGMTQEEFVRIADTFRDPRVWRREGGAWIKDNIWDEQPAEARLEPVGAAAPTARRAAKTRRARMPAG